MEIFDSVPVKNFILPVLHIQIGLGNYFLRNLIYYIESKVEKLSTGEEVARNILVTLNQVIAKRWQDCKIWDVNDDVMLRCKYIQINWLQAMKESNPGLNNDIGITITSD